MDALDVFCYALAHRPLLRSITICNLSIEPGTTPEMTVRIAVESPLADELLHGATVAIPVPRVGDETVLRTLRFTPNPGPLATLDEAVNANIVVSVHVGDTTVGVQREPLQVLAYNQWMYRRDTYDSFAAFVLPNHPDLRTILERARALLHERTGNSASDAMQSAERLDAARVDQLAIAIYDAVAERGFDYAEPPASFEGFGQKVRTPDLVIAERCCTCLDSTVLLASCLAAFGIDPVLFVADGHAFAGYLTGTALVGTDREWLVQQLTETVVDNANAIAALVAAQAIVPFETTTVTRSGAKSFAEARDLAMQRINAQSGLRGMVNVARARKANVVALPSRRRVGDVVEITTLASTATTQAPAGASTTPVAGAGDGPAPERARMAAFDAPPRITSWLKALLDLTYANPLLNLRDGRGAFRFELAPGQLAQVEDRLMAPNGVVEVLPATKAPNSVVDAEDVAAAQMAEFTRTGRLYWPTIASMLGSVDNIRKTLAETQPNVTPANRDVVAHQMVGDALTGALDKKVSAIKRKAREIETQVGSNNLFMTIGSVSWVDPQAARTRSSRPERTVAPLFLIPVRMTGSATTAIRIQADAGADVVPNYCLIEKLRQTYDVDLTDLERPQLDESGIDADAMLAAVRKALTDAHITDAVVEETTYLAVLNFSTFRLWKDLRDSWRDFMANPVVRHLVETPGQSFVDPRLDAPVAAATDLLLPVETDQSQLEAVQWAVSGRSFVLEGPPGTGKSQTIANLLAAAIAGGKKVLFVAEKQAALSVVKQRLERVGLAPFCLDLHDKGSKPDQIRQQLRASLDFTGDDRESEWADVCARRDAAERTLHSYRDAVHAPNAVPHTAWTAQQELVRMGEGRELPVERTFLADAAAHLPAVRDALLGLPEVIAAAGPTARPTWGLCDRGDFASLDLAGVTRLTGELTAHRRELAPVLGAAPALAHVLQRPDDLRALAIALDGHAVVGHLPGDQLAQIGTGPWIQHRDASLDALRRYVADQAPIRTVFHDTVYAADLTPIVTAATEAATAGIFSRGKKRKTFELLVAGLQRTPGPLDPTQAVGLLQQVDVARRQRVDVLGRLAALPGLALPPTFEPFDPAHVTWAEQQLAALPIHAAAVRSAHGAAVTSAVTAGWRVDAGASELVHRADAAWTALGTTLGLTDVSIDRWLGERTFLDAWDASGTAWASDAPRFLALQRWCEVIDEAGPVVAAPGLGDAAQAVLSGAIPAPDAWDALLRGLARESRAERIEAGRLDHFDGQAHDRTVATFVQRDTARRELMRTVIPRRLVTARPFKPGTRIGEYGALERELVKTTRRLSIRSLIERYGSILPQLTPCFLMSPDSVARFLPATAVHFDLVVFDEASQIEVAEAIGAMGRGDGVVVVGDSKQMPPSKFGGTSLTSLQGDDAAEPVDEALFEDLESILSECVESNMPRKWLDFHYRSRHEALITFSNNAFYEGRLITFPSPDDHAATPIHWRRIDGEFLRSAAGDDLRTNPVEAAAVVDEIVRRVHDPATAHQSICVVTLNIQQANLVSRLLEASNDETIKALIDDESEHGLIVRNLESVQGDERDVVILSVGFAPPLTKRDDGTVTRGRLPLNFGPLNRLGGERRLNVAVTRARESVVVFCSFDPEEMRLADEPAKGLQLLQQYLAMARDGAARSGDQQIRKPTPPDHHRAALADALRAAGLRVRDNVGLSDFRVDLALGAADRDDWPVAVLLDGPGWAQRATVYDRDALPPKVLTMMGWQRIERIWLAAWLQEPERILTDLAAAVVTAGEEADAQAAAIAAASAAAPPVPATDSVSEADTGPSPALGDVISAVPPSPGPAPLTANPFAAPPAAGLESMFVPAVCRTAGDRTVLDDIDQPGCRKRVQAVIDEIVNAEAPIHIDRLGKLVATCFGVERVMRSRLDDIAALVPTAQCVTGPAGTFVWTAGLQPATWRRYRRTPAGTDRRVEHIAPEEIVNAMCDLVRMGHAIDVDELFRLTAAMFDKSRLTAELREQLSVVLDAAIATGRLARAEEKVVLGPVS